MDVLRDDLGIKTDIDLRWEAVSKYEFCPLGNHVNHHLFTADNYEGIFNVGQDEYIILNYNLTTLSSIRCWHINVAELVKALDEKFSGLSLAEQLTMTIRSFGVTEGTIERIRNDLLEQL